MKFLIIAAATAAIAFAAPAVAQSSGGSSAQTGSTGGATVQSGGAMSSGHAITNATTDEHGTAGGSMSMKHKKSKMGSSMSSGSSADTGMANTKVGGAANANGAAGGR